MQRLSLGIVVACLIGIFVCAASLQAQVKLDSLRRVIQNASADTSRVLAYCELAYQLYNKNLDSTANYAKLAMNLAVKIKFDKGYGRSLRCEAIPYLMRGDNKRALELLGNANLYAERCNDTKGIADCQTAAGAIHRNQGNYEKALEYFSKALTAREKIKDLQGIGTLLNNIGVIYFDIHEYEKALEYYQRAFQLQGEINDRPGMGRSLTNLGQTHQALRQFNEALADFKSALQTVEAVGDKRGLTLVLSSLAVICTETGKLDSASDFLNRDERICEQLGLKDRQADLHGSYACYFIATDQPAKALEHARLAVALSKEASNANIMVKALEYYSQAAYKLKLYKDAYDHAKLRQHIQDSIGSDKVKRNSMVAEYALKQTQIKNELEKNKLEKMASDERHQRIINTFSGITVTVFVMAVFSFVAFRKFRKQNRILQKQRQALTEQYQAMSDQEAELKKKNGALRNAHDLIEIQNKEILENNHTLQKEVKRRTSEIVEYNRQLEKFAYLSAHNLRAPVARILGLSQLLEPTNANTDEQVILHLKKTADELDEVVRDLNRILQLKDGQPPYSEVNPSEEVAIVKVKLQDEIAESSAIIEECYDAFSPVLSIKPYFQFILFALIDNAIKYRDHTRPLKIEIETAFEEGNFFFKVTDNGLGLDAKHHEKLFDFYTRFHFHVRGKGLGLYISKSYADAMNGNIFVQSKVGEGSTFTLKLMLGNTIKHIESEIVGLD